MVSEYVEEYLETLYTLTEGGVPAKTTDIASILKVAPASVTEMLQKLAKEGYVYYKPYYGAILTPKGLSVARKIKRKHRLIERFFFDILKIKKENVHEQACKLEHALSDEVEEAFCKLLKYPDECPDDGAPIPVCEKDVPSCVKCEEKTEIKLRKKELVSLNSLEDGECGKIVFIRGDKSIVQRLIDMGLTKDVEIKILKTAPFNGPIEILVRGSKLAIGHELTKKIFLEK